MDTEYILRRLRQTIDLEMFEPVDVLASYMLGDIDDIESAEMNAMPDIFRHTMQRIVNLARTMESGEAESEQVKVMWLEIKRLVG